MAVLLLGFSALLIAAPRFANAIEQEHSRSALALKLDEGDWQGAIEDLDRLLVAAPQDVDLLSARANVLERLGDLESARAAYRQLVALRPDRASAWSRLGFLEAAIGRWPQAIEAFSEALRLEPCQVSDLKASASLYLAIDEPSAALADLDSLDDCGGPSDVSTEALWADALAARGRWREARSRLEAVYTGADLELELARLELLRGESESGQRRLAQALRQSPNDARAWRLLGDSQRRRGKLKDALSAYRRAEELTPGDHATRRWIQALATARDRQDAASWAVSAPLGRLAPWPHLSLPSLPAPTLFSDSSKTAVDAAPGLSFEVTTRVENPDVGASSPVVAGSDIPTERASRAEKIADLTEAVRSWARAWSRRDVEAYLSHYHPSFVPEGSMTSIEWRQLRRQRLRAPSFVRVRLGPIESVLLTSDRAVSRFRQTYVSSGYRDMVSKTLEMLHDGSDWRIVREHTIPETGAVPQIAVDSRTREADSVDDGAHLDGGDVEVGPPRSDNPSDSELTTVIERWIDAWESRDVERYLDYYSANFIAAEGQNREAWAAARRLRLSQPDYIQIEIGPLSVDRLAPDWVRVSFRQSYRSDRYRDVVDKALELRFEEGRWKILSELAREIAAEGTEALEP